MFMLMSEIWPVWTNLVSQKK